MKQQVILSIPTPPPLTPDNLNKELFYGVQVNRSQRGFIAPDGFYGKYSVWEPHGLTVGNGWTKVKSSNDLGEFVKNCICERYIIFQFGSFKELTEWLTEGKD